MWKRGKSSYLIGCLITLFVAVSFVAARSIGSTEKSLFTTVYNMPESLRLPALMVTQLGSAWVLIAVVGLLLVVKWKPQPALEVLGAGLLAYVLAELVKLLVDRPRPTHLIEGIVQREVPILDLGFPSGHVALATAVSLTLLPYLPRGWKWLPVAWIGLVGWSRMYLGVHAPLDILGGLILGILVVLTSGILARPGVWKKPKKS